MRLYHYSPLTFFVLAALILSAGCTPPQLSPSGDEIQVEIVADGDRQALNLPSGSTVGDALEAAQITLEGKDRVAPVPSTILESDTTLEVVRVREEFTTEEEVIPYQVIRQPSESLPEGEEQLLQAGENGLRQVTHVRVYENGEEVSYEAVNSSVVEEPVDEIVLVGKQSSVSPLSISGRIVYLSDGNAWMMEESTANRSLAVATGDLDGRIFSVSDDGSWLLFTRQEEGDEDVINSLWAKNISAEDGELIDLEAENIIHFADWAPGSVENVAFSTVESRVASPGWQANNDLKITRFDPSGFLEQETLVESIISVYGWWGTDFRHMQGDEGFLFSSPDRVGTVDGETGEVGTLFDILPYKTRGDWAWMPGISLGANGSHLFSVAHVPLEGAGSAEESPLFNLVAVSLSGGRTTTLVKEVGMFSYPLASPKRSSPLTDGEFQVAYLQAVFPRQSDTSKYRVRVMDRDGSNQHTIFPAQEDPGIEPSRHWGVWSPGNSENGDPGLLAVLYEGNIHVVNPETGESWPVTGDGRVQRMDWK